MSVSQRQVIVAAAVIVQGEFNPPQTLDPDRSYAPAWECLKGRSAFQLSKGTQSVPGCIPTQSVGTISVGG
ncbi:hypothetical protein CES87_13370 [Pseudomonas sp. ERMR1:02]|nr:hypothetical protein CES87_13370 [Pseudomonas sp. ERMR1:02]